MNGLLGKTGLILLAISVGITVILFIQSIGQALTTEPPQIVILTLGFVVGFGLLFVQAVVDRVHNKEDDYYSKHVKR